MSHDTWKEKNADDREFAENLKLLYPDRANDPRRKVDRDSVARRIPNYDPNEPEEPHEPDFEAIMERRAERRRPDWA